MKQYFFNNPIFRLVAPAVYGVMLYMLILLLNNNIAQVNDIFITQELYVVVVLTYLSFEALRGGILLANKLLKDRHTTIRIVAQVTLTVVASVVLVILALHAYFNYVIGFSISGTQVTLFAIVFGVTALLYNLMYYSHYFLHRQNTIKINAEKQQRTVLEMEMMEYRNGINPGLLYECLENLIAIMYKDVEKAEDYIDCLGTAYRYVLTNRENEMVPIHEELDACRNIIKLLNQRYGDQIRLECALSEKENGGMLIPGSLPLIIEYLVRNSIITGREPFVIRLYAEDDYLTLETDLNDRLLVHEASETAFAGLQRSYSLYTGLPLIKVKAYQQNFIKLPVLRIGEEIATVE